MNTQIQEAANKWFESMPFGYKYFHRLKNDEEIVSIWIQEVVKPYWSAKDPTQWWVSDESMCIAYLKEHESKEEIIQNPNCPFCMIGIRYDNPENGEMCAYHKRLYESKEVSNVSDDKIGDTFIDPFGNKYLLMLDNGKLVFTDQIVCYPYPDNRFTKTPKEEPVSVEESRAIAILKIATKSLMDVNFTAWHVANESANWQKEQDKAIIGELLEALELANGTLGSCLIMEKEVKPFLDTENIRKDRSRIFAAITKATNYINQQ